MLPGTYQIPTGVVLMLVGLAACFAGYRFFRAVLTVYGFVLGALFASTVVHTTDTISLLVTLGVGGLLGAAVLWFGYFVGVALAGGAFGAVAVHAGWVAWKGAEPGFLVVAFAAVAGAALAVTLQKHFVILATAFIGAETAIAGLMSFLSQRSDGRLGFDDVWVGHLGFPAPGRRWTFLGWVALGLVGAFVQFRAGGPPRRFGGRGAKKGD
jgi:hypothetical protein